MIIPDTKFELLKPKLEEAWSRLGYLEMLIHERGPPYDSWEWEKEYSATPHISTGKSTSEHLLGKDIRNIILNLQKITKSYMDKGRDPEWGI